MKELSTRRLTTRLALVFTGLSVIMALLIWSITREAVLLTEDRLSARHLETKQTSAEALYLTGARGPLSLDNLTMAFDSAEDLPGFVPRELLRKDEGIHEVRTPQGEFFMLTSHYQDHDATRPLYLLYFAEPLELTDHEGGLLSLAIVAITLVLMAILGTVLIKLSARLIQPVNELGQQLAAHQGDPTRPFTIAPEAAQEFQELTASLNHYRAEAHRLLQREQAFARYTSHELRTPITVIRGAARLLQNGGKEAFQARQRQRITSAAAQMEETVDALLSLVKYERNAHRVERPLTATELEGIIDRNRHMAGGKAIQFELQVQAEPWIQASEAVVAMVVGNLLRNAIAATAEGSIRLTLDCQTLTVTDPGVGLAGPSEGGHGLGLLIVDDLCHRYGWRFQLENHKEGGCKAEIRLKDI